MLQKELKSATYISVAASWFSFTSALRRVCVALILRPFHSRREKTLWGATATLQDATLFISPSKVEANEALHLLPRSVTTGKRTQNVTFPGFTDEVFCYDFASQCFRLFMLLFFVNLRTKKKFG